MGFFRDLVRRLFGGVGPEPTEPTSKPALEPEAEAPVAPVSRVQAGGESETPPRAKISQAELRAGRLGRAGRCERE